MKWIAPHFDFSTLAPAAMVLSRHWEIMKSDAKLLAIFGSAQKIGLKSLGQRLDTALLPRMFCTLDLSQPEPAPGLWTDKVRVRDIIRFRVDEYSYTPEGWTAGLETLVNHLQLTAMADPNLSYRPEGLDPGAPSLELATYCTCFDLEFSFPEEEGSAGMILDVAVLFEYGLRLKPDTRRIWHLAKNGF